MKTLGKASSLTLSINKPNTLDGGTVGEYLFKQ